MKRTVSTMVLWLLVLASLSQEPVYGERAKQDFCAPANALQATVCVSLLGSVPSPVANGTRQTVTIDLPIFVHQVTWQSEASTGTVSVVISASKDGAAYSLLTTSSSADGSYIFTGSYKTVGITITSGGSTTASYYGSAGTPISGISKGASVPLTVDAEGIIVLPQPVQTYTRSVLPLRPCNELVRRNCQ